jgi:ribosomal protein S18 acetylase RimI-like enzyme
MTMFTYIRCSELDNNKIYEAFKVSFCDYMVNVILPYDEFFKRFFGVEGNSLDISFAAFDNTGMPAGILIAGMKNYEGINTMRCDGLAVVPKYRGTEVSKNLFKLHKDEAVKNGCRQLFLEVIKDNKRAYNFYRRQGYEPCYEIIYYTLDTSADQFQKSLIKSTTDIYLKSVNIDIIEQFVVKTAGVHVNWQNDMDYMRKSVNQYNYCAYARDSNLEVGIISVNSKGVVNFIWVNKENRCSGIGSALIKRALEDTKVPTLVMGFPNNANIKGFIQKLGFKKDSIVQHEMYLSL